MRYFMISVLSTVLSLLALSCRETIGEQHNATPTEDAVLPTHQKEAAPSKKEVRKPLEVPKENQVEKKKKKPSDTLKQLVAIP